jgi:hypothetical protein
MTTHDLNDWGEFEAHCTRLQTESTAVDGASRLLFRGHADARWTLTTTLERVGSRIWTLSQYFLLASRVNPQVETFTGTDWKLPTAQAYADWLNRESMLLPGPFLAYEYFAYLRHHGFPSPLLDWSRSPHVAAYFAFRQSGAADRVAIFAYLEAPEGVKVWSVGNPSIHGLGPYVRTHRRHFIQQSEYTVCLQKDHEWRYCAHEGAFGSREKRQDRLWKFTLPVTERRAVLRRLDSHNVNDLSLFGSDESLLNTLAMREIELGS